ncbi:HAD family hydrolase [Altericista sp. CCNU0014]|uniref:HAD family hydrolase n=1 Tax=Altericista sp. CCNU0014 TaxID=3082949 RepID=UPI00384FFB54
MKLLVLDLDETLIYGTQDSLDRNPDFEVGPYSVYKRPELENFLSKVKTRFHLAVWTSSTRLYAES